LPANRTTGWSATVGLQWQVDQWRLDLVKLTRAVQTYRPQIDGVDWGNSSDDQRSGYEISLAETLDIRRGKFDDDDGELHLDTKGLTIRSDGLVKFLFAHPQMAPDKASRLSRLARHVSISWTRSEEESREVDAMIRRGDDVVQMMVKF
jgi:hypothetical protein